MLLFIKVVNVVLCVKVDRQTVFRITKVRTTLRKDGSWIRKSTGEPNDPPPRYLYITHTNIYILMNSMWCALLCSNTTVGR